MSASFTVSGGNTTINFSYTTTTENIISIIGDAAHCLWLRGEQYNPDNPVVFEDLTNQQKLNIVDDYLKSNIVKIANEYKFKKVKEDAVMVVTQYIL